MRTTVGYSFIFAIALSLSLLAQGQPKNSKQQQPPPVDPATLKPADFQYMLRGYCTAGSEKPDTKALGGFWQSNNLPEDVDASVGDLRNDVYLIAKPDEVTRFANGYRGMTVLLVNGTRKQQAFSACDSRIAIIQEAKDKDGEWKPIEYLPSSWCGNSYHTVFLGRKQYWRFSAPKYEGSMPTRLRFSLQIPGRKIPNVSNEFDGSINHTQFTDKQGHTPTGIMDPYNE